jgi:competence protein ComEC
MLGACVLGRRRWAAVAAGVLVGWLGAANLLRGASTDLVATFLDVGQGDAAVLELPHGHAMLVDGGGSFDPAFDPGELIIEPFLRRRHISRLDVVVMSHPHPDHMNGLPRILERFDVGELWEPGEESEAPAYRAILATAARRGIAHGPPGARDLGGARIEVLGPKGGATMARSTNDNSLVLRVSWAGRALLLPGDVERDAEAELLSWGAGLRADVLKAPHHGSRTSSTPDFLAAVAPQFAVFPAGAGNRFGFPHPEVLARYPCPTRITGRDGAVTVRITSDGALSWSTVREVR